MNFIVTKSSNIQNDQLHISSLEVLSHVKDVLLSSIGDELKIVVLGLGVGTGKIHMLNEDKLVLNKLSLQSGKTRNISIAVGLCRPLMTQRILEHGTTMGVDQFYFFHADLSEKVMQAQKCLSKMKPTRG